MKYSTILLFLFSFSLFAQEDTSKVQFGSRVGLTVAQQIFENDELPVNFRSVPGFYVGGTVLYAFSERVGLKGELSLDVQRNVVEVLESTLFEEGPEILVEVRGESRLTQAVVTMPVLFNYRASNSFDFYVGPQVAFVASSKFEVDRISRSFNKIKNIENSRVGVDIALGSMYKFTDKVYLEARYFYGLHYRESLRPSVFQFGLGYIF